MNAGDVIQSRYRLEETLGKGGMATVWRAHDLRLERSVALKCLMAPLSEDPTFLVRFFSEAQQVAKLSHPNVVRVLDFGEGGECPYLVMEFVPGGSLQDLTGEPMLTERAVDLIAGAARGAGAAHETGLIHRDLKPANIMVGEGDIAKVADFGIAVNKAQERFTATGTAIGSPHYVSPEQAAGRPVVAASDVYSLGVVLYELVAGRKPFEAENVTALAIAHVEEIPDPPSVHNPELDPAIDDIVMTCLSKDPAARFETGNDMAAALDALAYDGNTAPFVPAVPAAPAASAAVPEVEPPTEGAPKRTPRRVAIVSVAAAGFLGLMAFGVMALIQPGDVPREEKASADVVEPRGSINSKESPSPDPDDDETDLVEEEGSAASTPSPSVTPEDDEEDESTTRATREKNKPSGGGGGGDTGGTEGGSEPTPEPTSEPTAEPTSEPEPEPTSSP